MKKIITFAKTFYLLQREGKLNTTHSISSICKQHKFNYLSLASA